MKEERDNTLFDILELLAYFLPSPIPWKLNNVNSMNNYKY